MEYFFIGGLLFFLGFGSLALPTPDLENSDSAEYSRGMTTIAEWVWPFGLASAVFGLVGMIVS